MYTYCCTFMFKHNVKKWNPLLGKDLNCIVNFWSRIKLKNKTKYLINIQLTFTHQKFQLNSVWMFFFVCLFDSVCDDVQEQSVWSSRLLCVCVCVCVLRIMRFTQVYWLIFLLPLFLLFLFSSSTHHHSLFYPPKTHTHTHTHTLDHSVYK